MTRKQRLERAGGYDDRIITEHPTGGLSVHLSGWFSSKQLRAMADVLDSPDPSLRDVIKEAIAVLEKAIEKSDGEK